MSTVMNIIIIIDVILQQLEKLIRYKSNRDFFYRIELIHTRDQCTIYSIPLTVWRWRL